MWKKIKNIFIGISIVSLTIIAFIFGRKANRSGVSDPDQLNRDISDGLGTVQRGIDDSASNIGEGAEKIGTVIEGISSTETKLQSALGILRAAKEKNKIDMD